MDYDMRAKVHFMFENIDNNMMPAEIASVEMILFADDLATLKRLAEHMRKVLQGTDYFIIDVFKDAEERYR
jgi:hypothetical protein